MGKSRSRARGWGYLHHLLILISISQGLSEAELSLPSFWQPWLALGPAPLALSRCHPNLHNPCTSCPSFSQPESPTNTQYSAVEIISFYVSLVDNHKTKPNHWSPHKSGLALSRRAQRWPSWALLVPMQSGQGADGDGWEGIQQRDSAL